MRTPKEAVVPSSSSPVGATTPKTVAPHTPTAGERVLEWINKHRQASAYVAVALLAAVALVVWNITSSGRVEAEARASLSSARMAFDSRNYALASSELARVRENFSGTHAAEEATLLLAQVRLLQGQTDVAVPLLEEFASSASKEYRAQAYGLLAVAQENSGKFSDAAQAYERAADAAELDFMRAQFLSDAARTWLAAGDSARAISTYRRVVQDSGSAAATREATIRLGELTKGAPLP